MLLTQEQYYLSYDAVVFDEAQNLEDAATQFLGLEISNSKIFYFLGPTT